MVLFEEKHLFLAWAWLVVLPRQPGERQCASMPQDRHRGPTRQQARVAGLIAECDSSDDVRGLAYEGSSYT